MKKFSVFSPQGNVVEGKIRLNGSKSISNRVLIMRALSGEDFLIENLSTAQDTKTLQKLLTTKKKTLDAGAGGTTFRFLTAFLACQQGKNVVLTGSERMQQRPILLLVNALKQLGADIEYVNNEGFPPLHIKGKKLIGGKVSIPADTSSQYISALLMIGPTLEQGLELELSGEIVSKPYIEMTLGLMKYFGIKYSFKGNNIRIKPGKYVPKPFFVEADWSAASYFYEMAILAEEAKITLSGLGENSLQGDSIITKIAEKFGITSAFSGYDLTIEKVNTVPVKSLSYDFITCPDIAQTLVVACAGNYMNAQLKGLSTLKIKETDRISALDMELSKYGCSFKQTDANKWVLSAKKFTPIPEGAVEIDTYEDHRMAMSFAPLCLVSEQVIIKEPDVVAKSYPDFWKDISKLGFIVAEE